MYNIYIICIIYIYISIYICIHGYFWQLSISQNGFGYWEHVDKAEDLGVAVFSQSHTEVS